ncbi:MAG: site-2 protease family protein [Deltaproteobacteria bacterium]|nr:site-2 protease family protein [Deltaproteobacteria bacterium]
MESKIYTLLIYFPIFLISLTVHEFCHGFVALRKGDPTAKFMGRLTLNPIPHIDPIGTILFPIFSILFGGVYFAWAKPVPVDHRYFKNRVSDMFWVALAGPFSNFVLAVFSAWAYGLTVSYGPQFLQEKTILILIDLTQMSIYLNLALFFFNLIPLAPLDGSKILGRFLPVELRHTFENINPMYGAMALLVLFMTGILRYIAIPIFLVGQALQKLFIF